MKLLVAYFAIFLLNGGQVTSKLFPIAVRLPLNGTAPQIGGSLWPKPAVMTSTEDVLFLDRDTFGIKLGQSLDACEKDILDKLWLRYKHILFAPNFAHEKPTKNEAQLNSLVFELDKGTLASNQRQKSVESCSKTHYPFIQDTETEACKLHVN